MTETRAQTTPGDILSDIMVVDLTTMMAGPLCARYLADMGAEVVKIEPPGGDYMRSRPPLRDGRSAYFAQLNAGKSSLQLDLKAPDDIARLQDLIARADVLVENFRPGVMDRLGFGWEAAKALNPRLVYCSISGFGQQSPSRDRPAYAQVIQALSGYDMAYMGYQKDQAAPGNSVLFVADALGASFALSGILGALRQRDKDGKGHHVDLSLMAGMFNMMVYEVQAAQFPAERPRAAYHPLKARDGFVLVAPTTPKNFRFLCQAMERPELAADPRFDTVDRRYENWDSLMQIVQDWTAEREAAECEFILTRAGVPAACYNSVGQAISDPALGVPAFMAQLSDASGALSVPRLPFFLDRAPMPVGPGVPELPDAGRPFPVGSAPAAAGTAAFSNDETERDT